MPRPGYLAQVRAKRIGRIDHAKDPTPEDAVAVPADRVDTEEPPPEMPAVEEDGEEHMDPVEAELAEAFAIEERLLRNSPIPPDIETHRIAGKYDTANHKYLRGAKGAGAIRLGRYFEWAEHAARLRRGPRPNLIQAVAGLALAETLTVARDIAMGGKLQRARGPGGAHTDKYIECDPGDRIAAMKLLAQIANLPKRIELTGKNGKALQIGDRTTIHNTQNNAQFNFTGLSLDELAQFEQFLIRAQSTTGGGGAEGAGPKVPKPVHQEVLARDGSE